MKSFCLLCHSRNRDAELCRNDKSTINRHLTTTHKGESNVVVVNINDKRVPKKFRGSTYQATIGMFYNWYFI